MGVWVSNHFHYSDFGVRDMGQMRYTGRRYIADNTVPGTGFIERESESHSYHQFVRDELSKHHASYWKLLFDLEPDYSRELRHAGAALKGTTDKQKREILECYINALGIGRANEQMQRISKAVRKKMHGHRKKHLVSVLGHYKSRTSQLEKDMVAVEYNVKDHCTPEVYEAYLRMVDAFARVASCRRVWHYNEGMRDKYQQVFFDHGVFDFIRSESYLPLLRDSNGGRYYILPDSIIVARSSVDFDLVPLKEVSFVFQEMAIDESIESLSSLLGDAASMIRIPELNLVFYFNHVRAIHEFTRQVDKLKELL